jgi:hypothetical protein
MFVAAFLHNFIHSTVLSIFEHGLGQCMQPHLAIMVVAISAAAVKAGVAQPAAPISEKVATGGMGSAVDDAAPVGRRGYDGYPGYPRYPPYPIYYGKGKGKGKWRYRAYS